MEQFKLRESDEFIKLGQVLKMVWKQKRSYKTDW